MTRRQLSRRPPILSSERLDESPHDEGRYDGSRYDGSLYDPWLIDGASRKQIQGLYNTAQVTATVDGDTSNNKSGPIKIDVDRH